MKLQTSYEPCIEVLNVLRDEKKNGNMRKVMGIMSDRKLTRFSRKVLQLQLQRSAKGFCTEKQNIFEAVNGKIVMLDKYLAMLTCTLFSEIANDQMQVHTRKVLKVRFDLKYLTCTLRVWYLVLDCC